MSRIAALVGAVLMMSPGAIAKPPAESYVDQFTSGHGCEAFRAHPDFIWLETIGELNGVRHAKLADELAVSLGTLEEMMTDANATRAEIVELRVSTTSEAYSREVSNLIAATPELSGIPFSYRVVEKFTVPWARIGIDAVLQSPKANRAITAKYGVNVGPDCRMLPG